MIAAFTSVSEAQDRANHLDACAQALEEQIGNLQAEKVAIEGMKEATLTWIKAKSVSSPADSSRPVTVEDIMHCRNQREVLREYALRNGGYARLSDVANLVAEAGKSRGKRNSVRSTLTNYCRDSDEWVYNAPGVYRLKETVPLDELPEAPSRTEVPATVSTPADDGGGSAPSESTDALSLPMAVA